MSGFTEDLVVSAKDGLRSLRFLIRRTAARRPGAPQDGPLGLPRPHRAVARIADEVLSTAEGIALAVLDPIRPSDKRDFTLKPLQAVLPASGGADPAAALAGYHDAFARWLIRRHGVRAVLLHEHLFHAAATAALGGSASLDNPLRLSAGLAVAVAEARPVRQVTWASGTPRPPAHLEGDPNLFLALTMGLVDAILSTRPERRSDDPVLLAAGVEIAVEARFDRLRVDVAAPNPTDALAKSFGKLVPFLP